MGHRPPRPNPQRRWKGQPEAGGLPRRAMRTMTLVLGAYWEVKREKIWAAAYTVLLAIAYACAMALADARPAAEAALRYLSWRHPLWWFCRVADLVERNTRELPWWAQALALALVGLPLALAAALVATTVLALAFAMSALGYAAEDRWLPRLAEAWENR